MAAPLTDAEIEHLISPPKTITNPKAHRPDKRGARIAATLERTRTG